jgi:transcriptional regulator EpsA
MDELLKLRDAEDRNRLIHIMESSLEVHRASQFFAWTQGPLHALLPHEILICCLADAPGRELKMRYFTATRYFRQEHFEAACHPRNGLIRRVITHWRGNRQPCLTPAPPSAPPCDPEWEVLLHRLELRNMAGHGQMAQWGNVQSWFGFFRVGNLDHRLCLLLELLLPVITVTYARVVAHEQNAGTQALKLGNPLTCREVEVLELVRAGLTNVEIAGKLTMSVMTAKNHVQNIRVKLKVRTRGQAVVEAMRMGLIGNEEADV